LFFFFWTYRAFQWFAEWCCSRAFCVAVLRMHLFCHSAQIAHLQEFWSTAFNLSKYIWKKFPNSSDARQSAYSIRACSLTCFHGFPKILSCLRLNMAYQATSSMGVNGSTQLSSGVLVAQGNRSWATPKQGKL
jgi:hypothetical protein